LRRSDSPLILVGSVTDTQAMSRTARFGRAIPGAAAAAPVVVARQPIFDRAENVIGFELLSPPETGGDPRAATASVLVQSFADVGLDRLVGIHPAFVSVTREFLIAVRPLPLSPESVVLEIDASQGPDDVLVAVVRDAVQAGFRVALDDFRDAPGAEALLRLASIVKLDVARMDGASLTAAVAALRGQGVALFADNVATRAQYDDCRALGFDGFQGRFFSEPALLTGSSAPTYRLRALSMLAARGDMSSFEQLERVIVEDPGLSHKLVRLANSAFFGNRHRVGSIRQALMMLGSVAVRRWATLLVLAGVTDRPNHLLELGLTRARLCELLAARDPDADSERAFTIGLFSVVDALIRMPMSQLLEELPFDERTRLALIEHAGPEGRVLGGVLAFEAGDFDACAPRVSLIDIARAYRDALDWTSDAALQLA
jgi:EAL and modified HD-GYP domain-containing signal transduction protein